MKQEEAFEVLVRTINEISALGNRNTALAAILQALLQISGAQRACIFENAQDPKQSLQTIACAGDCDRFAYETAALALKNNSPVRIDGEAWEKDLDEFRNEFRDVKTALCIPVAYKTCGRAALYLDSSIGDFTVPRENYPVINALVIQALTENMLHGESGGGLPAGPDEDQFRRFCGSRGISLKEREVLLLMLRGFTKKQIARERSISVNTVKHHISNIYDKTGAGSREDLMDVFFARDNDDV